MNLENIHIGMPFCDIYDRRHTVSSINSEGIIRDESNQVYDIKNISAQAICRICGSPNVAVSTEINGKVCLCKNCAEKLRDAINMGNESDSKPNVRPGIECVRKWYKHFAYLCRFFDEDSVIETIRRICPADSLTCIVHARKEGDTSYYNSHPETYTLIGETMAYPDNDKKSDAEWIGQKRVMCKSYRTYHTLQHHFDGPIVLDLIYKYRPELRQFKFSAGAIGYDPEKYVIQPENLIITPLKALMERDIAAIKNYNLEYARNYKFDWFAVDTTKDRLSTKEAEHYFDTISNGNTKGSKNETKEYSDS